LKLLNLCLLSPIQCILNRSFMKISVQRILAVFAVIFSLTVTSFVFANKDVPVEDSVGDTTSQTPVEASNPKGNDKDKTPPVISNVEAASVSTDSATIVWITDEPADSDIDYGVAPGLNLHGPANENLVTSHSISLSGLTENTTYDFCLLSVDISKNRVRDCDHTFTTHSSTPTDTIPPVVTNIQFVSVSTSTVTINWVTDEISYGQVEYGTSESYGYITPLSTTLDISHSVVLTGLTASTTYHVRINARDDSGNASASADIPFSTLGDFTEPHIIPPVLSAIIPHEIQATLIHVSWITDELADSQIEYGTTTEYGFTTSLDTTLTLSHEQFPDNLTPDTTYHLRVLSHDYAGNLSISDDYEFATLEGISADPSPVLSSIMVTDIGTSSVIVTWTTDKPANSRVEYGLTGAYGRSTEYDETLTTTHKQLIENLSPHTTYHFRVISSDSVGNTSYSADVTFDTIQGEVDRIPPTAIHDLAANSVNQTSLILTWSGPEDASGIISYDINSATVLITEDNFLDSQVVHQAVITADDAEGHGLEHSYHVSGLVPGTTLYFAIKATDPYGNISPVSNVVSVTTLTADIGGSSGGVPGVGGGYSYDGAVYTVGTSVFQVKDKQSPARVSDVRAAGSNSTVFLTWKNPADSDFRKALVVRNESKYPAHPLDGEIIYNGSDRIVSDIGLTNNKTYYYAIFSADEVPNYSQPVQLSIAPESKSNQYNFVAGDTGTVTVFTNKDFGFGDSGPEVEYLQKLLATNPLLYPEGQITGYFGPLTQKALIRFQRKYAIPETGRVDADVRALAKKLTVVQQVTPVPASSLDLVFGMRTETVKIMQTGLVRLGYLTEDSITGYFGPKTLVAIIKFQKDNGITPAVGHVGPITRAKAAQIFHATSTVPTQ
jgi:peptidoglycan hydrolase-like protein with peptidoglycan-binding domain